MTFKTEANPLFTFQNGTFLIDKINSRLALSRNDKIMKFNKMDCRSISQEDFTRSTNKISSGSIVHMVVLKWNSRLQYENPDIKVHDIQNTYRMFSGHHMLDNELLNSIWL